jgi:hypothetical protein
MYERKDVKHTTRKEDMNMFTDLKKGKNSILKAITENRTKDDELKAKNYVPNSVVHTKLELPIYYSNLITIEDMKVENSEYFIRSNGFLTNNLKVILE